MLFRYLDPFGDAESVFALAAAAFGLLREHVRLFDRRRAFLRDLPLDPYRRKTDEAARRTRGPNTGFTPIRQHP